MSAQYLTLSFRFLTPAFHGRFTVTEPEWPPSPLRVFQSLVAAYGFSRDLDRHKAQRALEWLETLSPPTIIAPRPLAKSVFATSVPNNDGDIIAKAWSRGEKPPRSEAELRTIKHFGQVWLPEFQPLHYAWQVLEEDGGLKEHLDVLKVLARRVAALGLGFDFVVCDAQVMAAESLETLSGERWYPSETGLPERLRVPTKGSFADLCARYEEFLGRLVGARRVQVRPPAIFELRSYMRETDTPQRPVSVFALLRPDASAYKAYSCARSQAKVAAMVRHAVRECAERAQKDKTWIASFVLGHEAQEDETSNQAKEVPRFAYIPLPTIHRWENVRKVGQIRRVMITAFSDKPEDEHVEWVRTVLPGATLTPVGESQPEAMLTLEPVGGHVVREYLKPAARWVSVTPVLLPGYDDPSGLRRRLNDPNTDREVRYRIVAKLEHRIDSLLRKAIVQAGFTSELAAHALLEWRHVPFIAGAEAVARYRVPDHLKRFPRFHVVIQWRDRFGNEVKVSGPVCIGAGRYYGLGLFVRDEP